MEEGHQVAAVRKELRVRFDLPQQLDSAQVAFGDSGNNPMMKFV